MPIDAQPQQFDSEEEEEEEEEEEVEFFLCLLEEYSLIVGRTVLFDC